MSVASIIDRLELAFERARFRFPEVTVKWIYLNDEDWEVFDAVKSEEWGSKVHCFSFNDVQIRPAATYSRLTTKNGCLIAVPKRLSPRVRAKEAA